MLQLKNIKKDYPAGNGVVHALKGIDLQFRKSEFVSILGPSGCGKTTMLNIIGGLDQYTRGDLVINGTSTKDFTDRDWDAYRNHSIGFVFQSYNLIPHQTVLQNVELALTLSGVSKSQRRKRSAEVLEQVGLADQLNKKPSQLSGGQMQRVAIARALVNNPDIILADEPTGALDTQTSVQVMEILKEVAKDRLVVMVTHNPDLAKTYSSRIIRMLDGEITDDSDPYQGQEIPAAEEKPKKKKREKKPSMRFSTAFGLSLKNLISKKGRTILTSFAGSIGIIGIALIFAVSQGMTTYINTLQEETLLSYPLTLEAQHMDVGSLLMAFMDNATSGKEHSNDAVYQKNMFYNLVNSLNAMDSKENDLKAFKTYLQTQLSDKDSQLYQATSGVQYTYDADLLVYTENVDGTIIRSDTKELLQDLLIEYFGMDLSSMMNMSQQYGMSDSMMQMSPMGSSAILWQEILGGKDGELINPLLKQQYDVVYGSWPTRYDEIVLVVDENNEIDDMTLYALGLRSKEEVDALAQSAIDKTPLEEVDKKWSYEEICDMEFKVIFGSDCYVLDETTGIYKDLRSSETGMKVLYDNALPLKVSGILRPNEEATAGMLTGAIGYTSDLTKYRIENGKDSAAVQAQLKNPMIDIFTGLPFRDNAGVLTDEQKASDFDSYIAGLDEAGKAGAYIKIHSIPPQAEIDAYVAKALENTSREQIEESVLQAMQQQTGSNSQQMQDYMAAMTDEELQELYGGLVAQQYTAQYAVTVQQQLMPMGLPALAQMLMQETAAYTREQKAGYYDAILEFSQSSYEENLIELGYVDIDDPASINLYAATFESKDTIEAVIEEYNASVEELEKITYTDYVGMMMSSITSIINAITYVLIAFVAISLVVSSIMIGVITLISVQERTKEIGILRAIGASKRNVSSMFNAETVIIGFIAGALGVALTWLLCIPINAIIFALTQIPGLKAYLPWPVAIALVAISMLLTVFSGIIPSRSAAKKDPVVALRTE